MLARAAILINAVVLVPGSGLRLRNDAHAIYFYCHKENRQLLSLQSIYDRFPTENDCISFLEGRRWKTTPRCCYCRSFESTRIDNNRRLHCNVCNTSYSFRTGTFLHSTHIPLQKWIYALYLLCYQMQPFTIRALSAILHISKDASTRLLKTVSLAMVDKRQRAFVHRILDTLDKENAFHDTERER